MTLVLNPIASHIWPALNLPHLASLGACTMASPYATAASGHTQTQPCGPTPPLVAWRMPGAAAGDPPARVPTLSLSAIPELTGMALVRQLHAACLAVLLAGNLGACASPFLSAASTRAHMAALMRALAGGLKHVWMPLSPERLRFGWDLR